jgi:type I restriction enzyme S subunit
MSLENLPKEWVECLLGEIAEWGSGGTPSRKNGSYFLGTIPWIKTGELNQKYILETEENISSEAITNSSAKIFPKGSVAIAMYGATIGKTSILGVDASTNQACAVAIPRENITNTIFLYYLLLNEKEAFIAKGKGGAQPNISQMIIKEHQIPLPPIAEQKEIAAQLDNLLAQVDTIKSRLDKMPDIIKKFRQSVLSAAVTGKLTEEWRFDYAQRTGKKLNAVNELEIIKRKRIEVFEKETKKRLKKEEDFVNIEFESDSEINGWAKAKLNNLIYISARIGWRGLKAEEYTKEGPLFLSVHCLNYGEEVNFEVAYHISDERYYESIEIALEENDILLCKDGAGIGKIGIVKNLKERATVNSSLLVIRALEAFHYKYLFYFLSGPKLQNIVKERMTGTAVPHLFQKDIKEFVLSVPPIEEQHEIVRRVEELFAFADQIEARVSIAQKRINSMTQSILAKAFRGDLTAKWRTENPQLITGKNSAEALLEKIRGEKIKEKAMPKQKRITNRLEKMEKITINSLKDVLNSMPQDSFTFDELRERLTADYEDLKELLFQLLSESNPIVKQYFDSEQKMIKFKRKQP